MALKDLVSDLYRVLNQYIACKSGNWWTEIAESTDLAATVSSGNKLLLTDLPADIIFSIVDQLGDYESRVLLSVTCKSLYRTLNSRQKTSFPDHSAKIRFLQIYERDLPDHLTCRICGRLFKWRLFPKLIGCIPHPTKATCVDPRGQWRHWFEAKSGRVCLRREQIDLILKADEQGEQYGLPVSQLDDYSKGNTNSRGISTTYKTRLIRGELLILTCLTQQVSSWREARLAAYVFCDMSCPHHPRGSELRGILSTLWPVLSPMKSSGESELLKCLYCRTQCRISMHESPSKSTIMVQVRVWKSFGTRYDNSICNEQMFNWYIKSHVVVDTLSKRNLQSTFDAASAR